MDFVDFAREERRAARPIDGRAVCARLDAQERSMSNAKPTVLSRAAYADMFGPTTGDRVRLADTCLFIEVERDFTTYGEEVKFGGGKVIRDGMGQANRRRRGRKGRSTPSSPTPSCSTIGASSKPTSAASRGRIVGRSARRAIPDIQPGVDIIVGPGTEIIAGEGKILTAGGFDSAYPFHLPAADRGGADVGHHLHARRRHRSGDRHLRHHLHARPLASRPDDRGGGRIPHEPRLRRQGQRLAAREPARRAWSAPAPAR